MLFVGFSIIAGIGLLIAIVWVLHKYQQKENVESVDRTLPLPPLELRQSTEDELTDPEEILGLASAKTPNPEPQSIAEPAPVAKAPTTTPNSASDQWLASSKAQQAAGDFEQALATCHAALPQMGAFKQSALVLRAQIRAMNKAKQDSSQALQHLYDLAAMADFFHAKTAHSKPLTPNQCKKINYNDYSELRAGYQDLGYEHLTLLTKTDSKWLTQAWGEPMAHSHMHTIHPKAWDRLQKSLK